MCIVRIMQPLNKVYVRFRFGYVCASKTMALRRLLEAANRDTGFTNQEKGTASVRSTVCGGKHRLRFSGVN